MATYTKVKEGEYKVTVNGVEAVVLKISKTEWHFLVGDKVVTKGKTREKAVESAAKMKAESTAANAVEELTLDTLLDVDELPNIHSECIKRINPNAVEFWLDNCMSKSLQAQLSIIITECPSLYGEIMEYCLEDVTPYYRFLAEKTSDLSSLEDELIAHIFARFETEEFITNDKTLSEAVRASGQAALTDDDTMPYYAASGFLMAATRSKNAAYYAVQAGVKEEDIINQSLSLLY